MFARPVARLNDRETAALLEAARAYRELVAAETLTGPPQLADIAELMTGAPSCTPRWSGGRGGGRVRHG